MCKFPQNKVRTAYDKGCRCPRCVEGIRAYYNFKNKKYRSLPEYKEKEREWGRAREQKPDRKAYKLSRSAERRTRFRISTFLMKPEEKKEINKIYKEARALRESTGITYHVDHIVPLAYGGLHLPENLQIITEQENLKKQTDVHGVAPERLKTALTRIVERYGEVLRRLSKFDKEI